jgi:hypothetical protein
MARVRSGQAPAWPLFLTGGGAEAPRSRVAVGHFRRKREAPLTVEGRPRTLSGPFPDPAAARPLPLQRAFLFRVQRSTQSPEGYVLLNDSTPGVAAVTLNEAAAPARTELPSGPRRQVALRSSAPRGDARSD